MAGESRLQQAFAETGVQLDRIIDAYERKQEFHPETIVWYQNGTISSFNIVGTLESSSIQNITDITKIEIGNTVTKIGLYAFQDCEQLTGILELPPSVIEIGSGAFQYSGLEGIHITSNSISYESGGILNAFKTVIIDCSGTIEIENAAFGLLDGGSITFTNKTMSEVQALNNFSWEVSGTEIYCSDGHFRVV